MIDCRQCRDLVDRDLVEPLAQQDRATLSNHLRSCPQCVTYRKERLKDSSILRKSVAELKQQAEEAPSAPPPPPPRPPFWPWVAAAAVLILAAVGLITWLNQDEDPGPPIPPVHASSPTGPNTTRRTPAPVEPSGTAAPGTTPETAAAASPGGDRIVVRGQVRDDQRRPVPGARVALIRSVDTDAECVLVDALPNGSFEFAIQGRYPVFLTAWTDQAVSPPVLVHRAGDVLLDLVAGHRLEGVFQPEEGFDARKRRVVAAWPGGGRTVSAPSENGAFSLTVPTDRSVELLPLRDGVRTFTWVPPCSLSLSTASTDRLSLRAAPAQVVVVQLQPAPEGTPAGRPATSVPRWMAAINEQDRPVRFLTPLAGTPGAYHTTLPPGVYRLSIWSPGYRETLQEFTVQDLVFLPTVLEPSSFHLSGQLRLEGKPGSGVALDYLTVRRHPPRFAGEPGIRVPLTAGPDATSFLFQAQGMPWSSVVVEAGGEIRQRFGPFALPRQGVDLNLTLQGAIQGRVRDEAGKPLPGVTVTAESESGRTLIRTDDQGRYRFGGLPLTPVFVYPQCEAVRLESFPALKNDFRVLVSPSGPVEKDLVLSGARPSQFRLRDEEGMPLVGSIIIRTPAGTPIQAVESQPLDPTRPHDAPVVVIPPLNPGDYMVDIVERAVVYPQGILSLPGEVNLTVRRNQPRLVVKPTWRAGSPPPRDNLHITVRKIPREVIGCLQLPGAHTLGIGGLAVGLYEVEVLWGGHRGRGLARIPPPGGPDTRLEISLR